MNLEKLQAESDALSRQDQDRLLRFTIFLTTAQEARAKERQEIVESIDHLRLMNSKSLPWETMRLQDLDEAEEYSRSQTLRRH